MTFTKMATIFLRTNCTVRDISIYFIIIIIIIIIPGNHEVTELQKTAILGTAHILRKVLM